MRLYDLEVLIVTLESAKSTAERASAGDAFVIDLSRLIDVAKDIRAAEVDRGI